MSHLEPLGELIDSLGIEHCPEDGELVASAVVLLKTIDNDGRVGLRVASSDGLSWIERLGMFRIAEQLEISTTYRAGDDE